MNMSTMKTKSQGLLLRLAATWQLHLVADLRPVTSVVLAQDVHAMAGVHPRRALRQWPSKQKFQQPGPRPLSAGVSRVPLS